MLAAPEAHPLRAHWDYLAFLFRRLPALAPEEELERGYRDYLQVHIKGKATNGLLVHTLTMLDDDN